MTDDSSVPPLIPGHFGFFFDLDGTLAEIQPRPEQVFIPEPVRQLLGQLAELTQGAVALISGRSIVELDELAAPLRLPLAGVHGAERRDIHGKTHRFELAPALVARLQESLTHGLSPLEDTWLENKGAAFALHYRQAPQHAAAVMALAQGVVAQHPALVLQPGKCVVEIKAQAVNKGAAIEAFMSESPFNGRRPLFVGDDLTDESGFDVVNRLHGISIKVGEGETRAQLRLSGVGEVHRWLAQVVSQNGQQNDNFTMRRSGHESFSRSL
ncbi:trehalose-phosphatase [Jejubacter calystegiae]|uniref:Trehalose 6-phosphate phosphatase n=1 Tax=Jejubacter calystegiae TaxID=2579935 RepID=A0A4P8YPG1_9ENTR|nr:trehalose-phosphatase [Jejubacter calystegiae]QCT21878.1 trehalose-phosphatase [Jejubacter calystegiae]